MLQSLIDTITTQLSIMPTWMTVLLIIVGALLVALVLHRLVFALAERRLRRRQNLAALLILQKSRGPSALAVALFAVVQVLRLTPLQPGLATLLIHLLQIAMIALLTWIAKLITDIAGAVYLRRFGAGSEDDLMARKHVTQIRILKRAAATVIVVIGIASALMTFESVRQYGVSLFASAGVAGLAIGLAARPLLASMIAGIQIALTQPIRIGDAVIVEGEYGTVEEINATYVVLKLWDWRRMVLPLSYFIEKPFQNWTRESSSLMGSVMINVDYAADVDRIRAKLSEIVDASKLWDRNVVNLQVTDASENTMQIRALVSARTAGAASDLRSEVREKLIAFLRTEMPEALPRVRQVMVEARDPLTIRQVGDGSSPALAPNGEIASNRPS